MSVYNCPSEPNMDRLAKLDSGPGRWNPFQDIKWMPGSYRAMTGRARASQSNSNWWGNYLPNRDPLPLEYRGPLHTVGNPGPTGGLRNLQPVKLKQVKDGESKTLLVGERSIVSRPDRRTAWAYSYASYNKSAAYPLQPRIFLRNFQECERQGGPGRQDPCKHGWSSFHPRGMHFVHCDASVHFLITKDLDLNLFTAMATINGRGVDGMP